MRGEADPRQSESALLDVVDLPAVPSVADAVAVIAADAAASAAQYLSDTMVPHGGE